MPINISRLKFENLYQAIPVSLNLTTVHILLKYR